MSASVVEPRSETGAGSDQTNQTERRTTRELTEAEKTAQMPDVEANFRSKQNWG